MRIISGKYRAKKLFASEGLEMRPTSDRVKENIFNLIQNLPCDMVLDLFAGSGALGIECLSRGASFVQFCDISCDMIKKNLAKIEGEYSIFCGDAMTFLKKNTQKFDCIFLDPPYESDLAERALSELKEHLSEEFCVVIESAKDKKFEFDDFFEVLKEKVYGISKVTILVRNESNIHRFV